MNEEKTAWWRWPCAILLLLLGPVLISIVFGQLYSLTSVFIPRYFRESQEGINIMAGIVGIAAAIYSADNLLLSRHQTFLMVWSIVFLPAGLEGSIPGDAPEGCGTVQIIFR